MAGRIPESFIDDVLARTDIVELINSRVALKKSGKNYSACCPFHQEKTPSFTVSPNKQFYYCFGCGASGNAIGFLLDYEKQDFVDALKSLAQSAGLEMPSNDLPPQQNFSPLYQILETAQRYYAHALKHSPHKHQAINYLKKRGLSGEIAKQFGLGYAPPGWDNLVNALKSHDKSLATASKAGLVIEKNQNRYYDRFRDRIMFPIRDSRGRIIAFGGRVLGNEKPKYLNSPETPVFRKNEELYGLYECKQFSQKLSKFLIVEGYMDVIALAQNDIHYAVATLGTATSENHLEKLFRLTPEIIFCFDGDDAGRRAANRALEICLPSMKDGRQIKFLFLPEGEDPDSMVRKEGKELFEHRMTQGQTLSDYFFAFLREEVDTHTIDGKARLTTLAAPYIKMLPTGVIHQLMLKQLAELAGLDVDTLTRLLDQQQSNPARKPKARQQQAASLDYSEQYNQTSPPELEVYQGYDFENDLDEQPGLSFKSDPSCSLTEKTIRLLLLSPAKVADIAIPEEMAGLDLPCINTFKELVEFLKTHEGASTAALLGHWHGTQQGQWLAEIAAKEFLLLTEHAEQEFQDALMQLRRFCINYAIERQIEADRSNQSKNSSKLQTLLKQKQALANNN